MAWVFQPSTEAHNWGFTLSGTSFAGTFSAPVAVGDLLVASILFGNQATNDVTSVTDNLGNTWNRIQSSVDRGDHSKVAAWYSFATVAGTPTVTFNFNASISFGGWQLASFRPPVSSGFSLESSSTNTGSSLIASSSVTTTGTDNLVMAFPLSAAGSHVSSALTGFSLASSASGTNESIAYSDENVASTYTPGVNLSATGGWACISANFTAPLSQPIPEKNFYSLQGIPPRFQQGDTFSAPPKFGLIVVVPPTIENWTPTAGQKAVFLNYAQPDWVAPPKFGLLTISVTFLPARTSTDGQSAVLLNYSRGDTFSAPDKFGLTSVVLSRNFVNLAGAIQFPISPSAYIKLAGTITQPTRNYVNLLGTIVSKNNFVSINLAGTITTISRNYIKLAGSIVGTFSRNYIKLAGSIVISARNYINLAGTIVQKLAPGPSGVFSDAVYIKLTGWIVNPVSTNDSRQMPGEGFTITDDWLSSQDALASYKPTSKFTIFGSTLPSTGIGLLITAFTAGVVSFQTRTRTWLRRVDQAPGGTLINTKTNNHTLPNGTVITTTTTTKQVGDILTTTVVIQNSGTPTRTSTIITEKNGSGQTLTREIETDTINGIINTLEKKTIFTQPPTKDNIQPLQVRTLDGVYHYQFFGTVNAEWAGGDQEGLTTTSRATQIVPGTLNGKSTDPYGNLIYNMITDETETDPTGKVIDTHTEQIGTRKDIGTTTTDTTEQFQGLLTTVVKKITYPDGSSKVINTSTNPITGDSVQVTTETVTDEYNQVTTTVTNEETKIFQDPVTNATRKTITKTVNVTKGSVTTTDTSVDTTTDYEDDIIRNKVKVYFIQEITLTCVIDEFSMMALSEVNITHQKNYALLELFGQQLGNANLSFPLRQQLIAQFNQANSLLPVTLQALGRNHQVVFAQSASAFRAKYIPGTEPHCYELQMILQERSDLMNGAFGGG